MLDKLGNKRFALPLVVVTLVGALLALMFYPLLHMAPKNLPFAVLSLDQGAVGPSGEVNAGNELVTRLTASSELSEVAMPIQWNPVSSEAELDHALTDDTYFGALMVPEGFTEAQVAAQMGEGEAPTVMIILDNAKSPIVATQMQPALAAIFDKQGIATDIEVLNPGNPSSSSSPLSGMMALQLSVMPLMIMSLVGSVLLTRILPQKAGASRTQRYKIIGEQLAYAVALAALASLIVIWLLNIVVSAGAAFWPMFLFVWFSAFVIMTLFIGAFNMATWFGGLLAATVILLGTMTATLPLQMLPDFWANWVYPWAPQHLISAGVRDILYRNAGLMPWGTVGLLIVGAIGLTLVAIAGSLTWGKGNKAVETTVVEAV